MKLVKLVLLRLDSAKERGKSEAWEVRELDHARIERQIRRIGRNRA